MVPLLSNLRVSAVFHFFVLIYKITCQFNFFLLFLFHWLVIIRYQCKLLLLFLTVMAFVASSKYWALEKVFPKCSLMKWGGCLFSSCSCCIVSIQIFDVCLYFQDIKIAAMNCIEGLQAQWARVDFSSKKNGIPAVIIMCVICSPPWLYIFFALVWLYS